MKKSWIIALSSIFLVIITIVILCFTLFTVQTINIDWRTSLTQQYDEEQIIASSGIKKGKNIFFIKKQPIINNIEKNNPYIGVVNIETSFPSTLTIHVRERQGMFAVKNGQEYFILDDSLKVLDNSDTSDGYILLQADISASPGDFVKINLVDKLYSAALLNGRSLSELVALISNIAPFESPNEFFGNMEAGLDLTLNSGRKVYIHNGAYALANKLGSLFSILGQMDKIAKDFGEEAAAGCEIHLQSLVGDPNDHYAYFVYNGERLEK